MIKNYIKRLKRKKIGILGFGIENQALVKWFIDHKIIDITICDQNPNIKSQITNKSQIKNIKFKTGKDYLDNLENFDVVFRTPGISPLTKELVDVRKKGVEISSQIKLFFDLCPAKIIGVTGTKGKGTTSDLIFQILNQSNKRQVTSDKGKKSQTSNLKPQIYLGGNIGNPPIEFIDSVKRDDVVILELSSFQLQDMKKSPNIAVILDIKIDHLDYHKNRSEYVKAKENIVKYQKKNDNVIVNLDYLTSFKFAAVSPAKNVYFFSRRKLIDLGTYIKWDEDNKNGRIILKTEKKDFIICKVSDVILRGKHNLENICAAVTASYLSGVNIESIKGVVSTYKGLEHRLEYVGMVDKVGYYNDSFSTTPETAIAAIRAFSEPIILVVGGSEKGADYDQLGKVIVNSTVKTVIAIGDTGPRIIAECRMQNAECGIIKNCKNMQEIVQTVKKASKPGDIVLLSPASASFGMFKNYKDRGDQFKQIVTSDK